MVCWEDRTEEEGGRERLRGEKCDGRKGRGREVRAGWKELQG